MIIGLDLETTSLDIEKCAVVEFAVHLYTDDLVLVDSYACVLKTSPEDWEKGSEVAKKMHMSSGLYQESLDSSMTVEDLTEHLMNAIIPTWNNYAGLYGTKLKMTPLLGNSVHFDRAIMRRVCPEFIASLYHRNVDVSSFSEMCKRWNPKLVPDNLMTHRASEDIHESVRVLKEYRKTWLRPPTLLERLKAWF